MSLKNQIIAWVSLLVITGLFLWIFRGILLPFVLGIGLAYLLNPPVTWLAERGLHRGVATAIAMLVFLLIVIVAILLVVPVLVQQGLGLARNMPGYFEQLQGFVEMQVPRLEQWLGPQRMEELERGLEQMFADGIGILTNFVKQCSDFFKISIINNCFCNFF